MPSPSIEPASEPTPAVPRLAVSVLMLRRDAPNVEVFIQNRAHTMDFAAGVVVFPGGRVDDADYKSARADPVPPPILQRHASSWAKCSVAAGGPVSLAEMSGVLLAAALREVEEETGALLSVGDLLPWANWITPPERTKRFDTYFYLTVVAPSLEPRHQTTEADSSHWAPVGEILRGADDGRLKLMRPTRALLLELADLSDVAGLPRQPRVIIPVGRR